MKQISILILSIILTNNSIGQTVKDYSRDCYNIQFVNKDSIVVDSMILPVYQTKGFLIVENGVYDFVIDGKKYFQSLLTSIDNNGFWITKDWEFDGEKQIIKDSLHFKIQQDFKVRLISIDKGVGGLPYKVDKKKYNISLVHGEKYCKIKNAVITTGKEVIQGHYYFTEYGWKKLKMVKGTPFLCEDTGEYKLRRK